MWKTISEDVERRERIGSGLVLVCSKHPDSPIVIAKTASDFDKCPNGGCQKPCGVTRECGHVCPLLCHPIGHKKINCFENCTRPFPGGCSHPCRKRCWEKCGNCPEMVSKTRNFCGHTIRIQCHVDVETAVCSAICKVQLLCGHECPEKCHPKGHDFLRHKCSHPCTRTHPCTHPCPKKCFEDCGNCEVPVTRVIACGHEITLPCYVDVSTYVCRERCLKQLPCGHRCNQLCQVVCDTRCYALVEKTYMLCSHTPKHSGTVPCYSEEASNQPCDVLCNESLKCGHCKYFQSELVK